MDDFGLIEEDVSLSNDNNLKYMELRQWQKEAIDYFFKHNCAIFNVVTGAGKSRVSVEIIKKIWETDPKIKVLIVCPKNVVLEQWQKVLYENGISLVDIGFYYGLIKEPSRITITNIQSIKDVRTWEYGMIVADEVHHLGTDLLLPFLREPFKYKLGLTATLQRMDDKHYDILKEFKYNTFDYSAKQALEDEVLNPFMFYNVGLHMDYESQDKYDLMTEDLNNMLQAAGSFNEIMRSGPEIKNPYLTKLNQRKDLVNNYPLKFEIVKQIVDKHRNDKIIIFNEYNSQSDKTYWQLLESDIKCCIVHSNMDKSKREENLIDFRKGKYQVLITTKVLDEGWDLPQVEVAIIAAGNSTYRQTIQRMGRVLRKKATPSILYQIYCLNTIEERYGQDRARIFKELCLDYNEYVYRDGERLFI